MKVYLAWLNDGLLDAYKHRADAEARLAAYRQMDTEHEWKQLHGGRWCQPRGSVARLEVEERSVIDLTPIIHADVQPIDNEGAL